MSKRFLAGAAALAAAALLLTACSAAPDDSESGVQAESFPAVYAQTIDWGECGEDFGLTEERVERLEAKNVSVDTFTCAMVEVPFDWNDPRNHDTIELAAVHIPATGDKKLGTLFGNPGGPGGSGLDFAYGLTASPAFAPVSENYDMVGFDPRGIGHSTPLVCEPKSNVRELQLALCAADQPIAHTMGTSQVARDMDLLRALQGDEKMNYLGYSYGTILGATYSTLFPERVGRVVLDSAPDNKWAAPTGDFEQLVAMTHEIVALVEGCGTEYDVPNCPITSEDELIAAMAQLTEQPLIATDGTEVTGGTLYAYLQSGLYGQNLSRITTLDAIGRALSGEQEGIDEIVEALSGGGAAVSFDGQIVRCHSLPRDPDLVGLINTMEEQGVPKLMGGPELNEDFVASFADLSCDALPEAGDDLQSFKAPDDTTVLMLGVTGDHATPYENGKNLAAQMGNTRFVTLEGHGHGASFSNRSTCADDVVANFLNTGKLPEKGLVCQAD